MDEIITKYLNGIETLDGRQFVPRAMAFIGTLVPGWNRMREKDKIMILKKYTANPEINYVMIAMARGGEI